MSARPVGWGSYFVIVALLGILIGCGKTEDPPAVVEAKVEPAPEVRAEAEGKVGAEAGVTYREGHDDSAEEKTRLEERGSNEKHMYNLTSRSLTVYGRSGSTKGRLLRAG